MAETKPYRCVNCGNAVSALYKTYGPSVLKLTKCSKCKGIVDKYIEYDPVIVMIDLILMSKEAQRHIVYNTEFKSMWKLLIVLMILETYSFWKNDSLFNIVVNTFCEIPSNSTINITNYYNTLRVPEYLHIQLSESRRESCRGWVMEEREDNELFIWEKDFYILFVTTFIGTVAFMLAYHLPLKLFSKHTSSRVGYLAEGLVVVKAFALAQVGSLFALPMLVWGSEAVTAETRSAHYLLAAAYTLAAAAHACVATHRASATAAVTTLLAAHALKAEIVFTVAPRLRLLLA